MSVAQRTNLGLELPASTHRTYRATTDCDRSAGAFYDPDRQSSGVVQSLINSDIATAACQQLGPSDAEARRIYQSGRALLARNDLVAAKRAFEQSLSMGYRAAGVDLADLLLLNPDTPIAPARVEALYEQAWQAGVTYAGYRLAMRLEEHALHGRPAADAWEWYQKAANAGEPDAIARVAQRDEEQALIEPTPAKRQSKLHAAFAGYAQAAAIAENAGWPDEAWKGWRYRRSSLARYLAREGAMQQVADAYLAAVTKASLIH